MVPVVEDPAGIFRDGARHVLNIDTGIHSEDGNDQCPFFSRQFQGEGDEVGLGRFASKTTRQDHALSPAARVRLEILELVRAEEVDGVRTLPADVGFGRHGEAAKTDPSLVEHVDREVQQRLLHETVAANLLDLRPTCKVSSQRPAFAAKTGLRKTFFSRGRTNQQHLSDLRFDFDLHLFLPPGAFLIF